MINLFERERSEQFFKLVTGGSNLSKYIESIETIKIQIGTNNWDVETLHLCILQIENVLLQS